MLLLVIELLQAAEARISPRLGTVLSSVMSGNVLPSVHNKTEPYISRGASIMNGGDEEVNITDMETLTTLCI